MAEVSRLWRKMCLPMLSDVDAAAEPDVAGACHMFQQLDQSAGAAWAADQPVMQADRQQLWRSGAALGKEEVEGVAHIVEELLAGREAGVFVEAVVVGFIRIRDDEV